jgi:hypothetical protein
MEEIQIPVLSGSKVVPTPALPKKGRESDSMLPLYTINQEHNSPPGFREGPGVGTSQLTRNLKPDTRYHIPQ